METMKPVMYLGTQCVGCGGRQAMQFILPKYVISEPMVACSLECLRRWEVTTQAHMERQAKEDFVD